MCQLVAEKVTKNNVLLLARNDSSFTTDLSNLHRDFLTKSRLALGVWPPPHALNDLVKFCVESISPALSKFIREMKFFSELANRDFFAS